MEASLKVVEREWPRGLFVLMDGDSIEYVGTADQCEQARADREAS